MLTKCRRLFFESVPLLESESNWQYVQVDFPISVARVFSRRKKIDASSLVFERFVFVSKYLSQNKSRF